MRQFKCVPITYVTEIKETYFETDTSFPLLNISNCQSVLKYLSLYLHDSYMYITKFDFVNYAFSKLVVAWLYVKNCKIIGPKCCNDSKISYLYCIYILNSTTRNR